MNESAGFVALGMIILLGIVVAMGGPILFTLIFGSIAFVIGGAYVMTLGPREDEPNAE